MTSEYIIPRINKYVRIVNEATNKKLGPLGIYTGQWSLILALHELGSATQSELIHYLSIEAPTLTNMLRRLEEAELIKRETCQDRRAKLVSLTKTAQERFPLWNHEIQEYRKQLFKGFAPEEMQLLSKLMDRLLNNVKKK
jgi:MarR family transcriptional regulator, transcriptional regulator for hemolysin